MKVDEMAGACKVYIKYENYLKIARNSQGKGPLRRRSWRWRDDIKTDIKGAVSDSVN
jgi:hypothetical protein